ncbi:MAG: hypothetical protein WCN97_00010 [Thermoleophilia bacterium]
MARSASAVAFSVSEADLPRLERLVALYGRGNRSELLRLMLDRFEAAERAERLRHLQAYGAAKAAERGLSQADAVALVRKARLAMAEAS